MLQGRSGDRFEIRDALIPGGFSLRMRLKYECLTRLFAERDPSGRGGSSSELTEAYKIIDVKLKSLVGDLKFWMQNMQSCSSRIYTLVTSFSFE